MSFVRMLKLDEEYEDLLEDNQEDLFLQSIEGLMEVKSSDKFGNHLTYLEQLEDLKVRETNGVSSRLSHF